MAEIAVDSSTLIALLYNQSGADTELLLHYLQKESVFLPPPVVSEVLSYIGITKEITEKVKNLPLLPIEEGYWQSAGGMRRLLLSKGLKAHLPDALIAQSCIDHNIHLLTRDEDFRHYVEHCGLKLAKN